MKNTVVCCFAIAGIAGMEMWAMAHGHDGLLMTLSVAAITGIAGYNVKGLMDSIKGNNKQ